MDLEEDSLKASKEGKEDEKLLPPLVIKRRPLQQIPSNLEGKKKRKRGSKRKKSRQRDLHGEDVNLS